jgi:triacylglycerol lipase
VRRRSIRHAVLLSAVALALVPSVAVAERHGGSTGPALGIARVKLAAGLSCSRGFAKSSKAPVLLTPAFSSAELSYGWNYIPQLTAAGIPFCSISVPDGGYGDLQKTAEYVVYGVRRMSRVTGRKVTLLGHQHGGLDELWALTFWPDVARSVSDLVTLATPHSGTTSSTGLCSAGGHCTAALRQITKGSRFLSALRAAPLPKGVAITSISSKNDALIVPQPAASRRKGIHHVLLQRVCPGREVDHFAALADNVAYRLFLDARSHRGPASAARLPARVCAAPYMPAADPATLSLTGLFLNDFFARNAASNDREPRIAAYARPRRG